MPFLPFAILGIWLRSLLAVAIVAGGLSLLRLWYDESHVTIALWPLVWLMDIMSYLNGSAHRSTSRTSFAGTETPGQLDFVASYVTTARPDVMARGMLGMMAYDATATLPSINVPVLTVVGDRDTMTLPDAGQFIAQNVPMGGLTTLVPARHMGLMEHHQVFNQAVATFVESCRAASVAH